MFMCVHVKCFKILSKNFFKWVKFRAKSTHFGIFFSWKCVMTVHRHFLYHRKHNALFKKCFQLVDGMMTVNTNKHDLPSLRTGIRRGQPKIQFNWHSSFKLISWRRSPIAHFSFPNIWCYAPLGKCKDWKKG